MLCVGVNFGNIVELRNAREMRLLSWSSFGLVATILVISAVETTFQLEAWQKHLTFGHRDFAATRKRLLCGDDRI